MALKDAFDLFEEKQKEAKSWLNGEISSLRTGRVRPNIVERLVVEHYGARTPLAGLASITAADARTLVISPWDPGAAAAIEKAVTEANLGVQPVVESNVIRLVFPSLTEEARARTVKLLHKRAEEARVKLRQARDEALKLMREAKEAGDLTEDDLYDGRDQLDKLIGDANQAIEDLTAKKAEDVMTV